MIWPFKRKAAQPAPKLIDLQFEEPKPKIPVVKIPFSLFDAEAKDWLKERSVRYMILNPMHINMTFMNNSMPSIMTPPTAPLDPTVLLGFVDPDHAMLFKLTFGGSL